jgi:hypothetical protein
MLTEKQIQDISDQITLVSDLSDDHLVEFCKIAKSKIPSRYSNCH